MLYQLGGLQFRSTGLGPHEVARDTAADYAEKDVVGGLKPAEFVGEGDDEIVLTCCLPSQEFGGLSEIALLDQMRISGTSHIFVRGDGYSLGWRRITKIREKHRYLDGDGIGRVIDLDLTLKKSVRPSAAGMLSFLYTLLGGLR